MAISTIGTDALASAAVTSAKLASGAPSRSQLPAGTILQVVQGSVGGSRIAITTASFISTGLTATITPTSATSKILVVMGLNQVWTNNAGRAVYATIYRNSTNLAPTGSGSNQNFGQLYGGTSDVLCNLVANYVDSPATTSATTYTIYVNSDNSTVSINQNSGTSYIQLLEIAA